MKVVLFCGGLGLRLRGGSEAVPKPMVTIGGRPILWHVMKYYAHYGHRDFIICLGYRGDVIRRFFSEEETLSDCRVTYVDTGLDANIGQRLRAVRSHVQHEPAFLANYSDGLTDLDLPRYVEQFRQADKIAGVLCVQPNSTLHVISMDTHGLVDDVYPLGEAGLWVNGGFFIFKRAIFDYIGEGEDLVEAPFRRLIRERELFAYHSDGFWACMDTFKDKQALEAMYRRGHAPWEVWRQARARPRPSSGAVIENGFDRSRSGSDARG
jgi:glucose-1-phosphate cytidylyltransferase